MSKQHQKHAKLAKPSGGQWSRTEIALLGAPCEVIREMVQKLIAHFSGKWNIGFADAEHQFADTQQARAAIHFLNRGTYYQIDVAANLAFNQRSLFNACDLVLVNGNHFSANQQILFVHPQKKLTVKQDMLTDVQLIILTEEGLAIPDCLQAIAASVPVISLQDEHAITDFFESYLAKRIPALNGLVLAGGQSQRMGSDKSLLQYHAKPQRTQLFGLLQPLCQDVLISCNAAQSSEIDLPKIEDKFLGIGPLGGILSAFQSAPNAAWLVAATDMPHLSATTLNYLIEHRNPSKLATAFIGEDGLPEPLITIWEPRAYPVLLQALSMGISCPRKILSSDDIALLHAPCAAELQNINLPAERDAALNAIQKMTVSYSA